jgi:hypothetical protein
LRARCWVGEMQRGSADIACLDEDAREVEARDGSPLAPLRHLVKRNLGKLGLVSDHRGLDASTHPPSP